MVQGHLRVPSSRLGHEERVPVRHQRRARLTKLEAHVCQGEQRGGLLEMWDTDDQGIQDHEQEHAGRSASSLATRVLLVAIFRWKTIMEEADSQLVR